MLNGLGKTEATEGQIDAGMSNVNFSGGRWESQEVQGEHGLSFHKG